MAGQGKIITLPPGRMVGGSLYEPNTKDAEGKPLTVKSGANMGQPRVDFYVAIAIPKKGEAHWAHTDWGKELWAIGSTAFPAQSQRPDFAWKVTDGDSTIPNKKGKIPNQQAGHAGHWIIKMSSGFASPLHIAQNGQWVQQMQKDFANPGDFLQAQVLVNDNGSQSQPGIYVNHRMFAFLGHGERIQGAGPDANAAGFSMGYLPPGASATPLAAMPMPAAPGAAPAPAPLVPGMPGAPGTPAPIAPPPPMPPAGAPAPAAPARVMLPAAQGATYEQLIANGWTDATLVQHGMMAAPAAVAPAPLPPATSAPVPAAPAAPIAPAIPVTPNPAFPQIPPAAPAAPVGPQLTPAGAALGTYEGFRAQGWQDSDMRAAGYLV